jgi:hypothetical protein
MSNDYLAGAINKEIDEWLLDYEDDLLMIENTISKRGSIKSDNLADWITEDRMSYDV